MACVYREMLPWAFSVHGAEPSDYVNFEVFLTVRDNTKKKYAKHNNRLSSCNSHFFAGLLRPQAGLILNPRKDTPLIFIGAVYFLIATTLKRNKGPCFYT